MAVAKHHDAFQNISIYLAFDIYTQNTFYYSYFRNVTGATLKIVYDLIPSDNSEFDSKAEPVCTAKDNELRETVLFGELKVIELYNLLLRQS